MSKPKAKRPTNVVNVVPSVKKPKKPSKNAAQRQLDADWQKMIASHQTPLEKGARAKGIAVRAPDSGVPKLTTPPGRESKHVQSKVTPGGNAPFKETPKYTGTKMKGIATMHKSNSVPVFTEEEAVDISKMRR